MTITTLRRAVPDVTRDLLIAVDGRRHIAVAAGADGEPIGIARLITVAPGRAELAVEVVDACHGRGVGARLVRAVADLGRHARVTEIVAEVLAENVAVRRLLASVFPDLTAEPDGPEIACTAHLTPQETLMTLPIFDLDEQLAAEHRRQLLAEAAEHRVASVARRRRRQLRLRLRWAATAAAPVAGEAA